jgi:hypothetical protein
MDMEMDNVSVLIYVSQHVCVSVLFVLFVLKFTFECEFYHAYLKG